MIMMMVMLLLFMWNKEGLKEERMRDAADGNVLYS
jgi:hypothetical protein